MRSHNAETRLAVPIGFTEFAVLNESRLSHSRLSMYGSSSQSIQHIQDRQSSFMKSMSFLGPTQHHIGLLCVTLRALPESPPLRSLSWPSPPVCLVQSTLQTGGARPLDSGARGIDRMIPWLDLLFKEASPFFTGP